MDIERKYNFGKKYSEILGLIDDSREKVDSVESSLRQEITNTATTLKRDTEQIVMEATKEVKDDVSELSQKVEFKVDANAVNIAIERKWAEGIDQVETATGYRFDAEGLNISRVGEEMSNTLDNTGMYVKRSGETILAANNKGVEATNLHAKTYLIIGTGDGRSRLEDYLTDRTGVFWIG
jgi:hypothetical protein